MNELIEYARDFAKRVIAVGRRNSEVFVFTGKELGMQYDMYVRVTVEVLGEVNSTETVSQLS